MFRDGKVITFYSYNGGTGRTMAVTNMAWILASNGYKILLVDWNLESPGLHRYFRPFLGDPDLTRTAGLIDFVCDAAQADQRRAPLPKPVRSLMKYVVPVNCTFAEGGTIHFVGAGRQDESYPERVNTFNWREFRDRCDGNRIIDAARKELKANYDYVLIDGRSGVSDALGISTVRMPDQLVVYFTLNHKSIEGAARTLASIQIQRAGLPIYTVPSRVDYGEQAKLAAATAFARRVFAPFLLHTQSDRGTIDLAQQVEYWREVETPYVSYYAFEEIPAALKDEQGSPRGLLAASERLASRITNHAVTELKSSGWDSRSLVLEGFGFGAPKPMKFEGAAAGASRTLTKLRSIGRSLSRHRWQVATLVLSTVIILFLALHFRNSSRFNPTMLPEDGVDLSTSPRRGTVGKPLVVPGQSGEPLPLQR